MEPDTLELVAAQEHEQWAYLTRHILDIMTPEKIEHWKVLMKTPYSDLTEEEKDKDREWAIKILEIIKPLVEKDLFERLDLIFAGKQARYKSMHEAYHNQSYFTREIEYENMRIYLEALKKSV